MDDKEKALDKEVLKAGTIVKFLLAIMNEEEDIEAYYDKTEDELNEMIKLIDARYPENKALSYDPMYTIFGQVFRNGYNTFGVDFLKILAKRTDTVPIYCFKGLEDIIVNQTIMCDNLTVLLEVLIKLIKNGSEEERNSLIEAINSDKDLNDLEFLKKYFNEVEQETQRDIVKEVEEKLSKENNDEMKEN